MNNDQRINLQKLISKSDDYVDNTEKIRALKHSDIIKLNVNKLIKLRDNTSIKSNFFTDQCAEECNFLFTYYPQIFNKVLKNEIDISMLNNFISCLKEIEDGKVDQNEASVKVGTILKEMYIDSALRKANMLDQQNNTQIKKEPKNISWKQFKMIQ
jgi:hypothetical protein